MDKLQLFFFDTQNQIQIGLTLVAVAIAFIMRWAVRRAIKKAHLRQKSALAFKISEFIKPIFVPVTTLLLMSFVYFILERLQIEGDVIKILSQFVVVWLVLAMLHVSTNSRFAQWSIVLLIIPIIGLQASGLLQPFSKFLESLNFAVGKTEVSVYSVMVTLITIAVMIWVARLVIRGADAYLRKFHNLRASNRELILKACGIVLYVIVGLSALRMLGIDLTALAVFGGAIGVGLGFGLQKITSNFVSGIIMLFEKSVEVDDLVELADGTTGFIRHTGARATLIETGDGREVMIPNENFIINQVTNWTYSNTRGQVEIVIGVSYESDIKKAQELMLEAALEHPRCSKHPDKKPNCFLTQFADFSINFKLAFWIEDVKSGRAGPQSEVMFAIWDKFKANGIEVPYPHQEIYVKELPKSDRADA